MKIKKAISAMILLTTSAIIFGQAKVLNATESDPATMKWMQGFPPEKDKIVSAVDNSFFAFPALRYSVNHMREFFPTREVKAGKENYFKFKTKIDNEIENVTFIPWNQTSPITFKESLDKNYVDGIIILHKGKIVYEKYSGGLKEDGLHAAMSVSKSFTGILGSILIAEGVLNPEELVTNYVPELKDSAYEGATVQQVLDMTTSVKYSENYSDVNAEVWKYSAAGSVYKAADYKGPQNYYEYLPTLKKIDGVEHGEQFGYKTVNTEVMGWVISRVTGKCITELISEKIWIPMGAKYDGYYQLDPAGKAFAGGGFDLNLRDMAVFAELLLNNGKSRGKQIIPQKAVKEVSSGGSQEAFSNGKEYPSLKGWSYHNMWWITNNSHKAYMARGVHGQAIYIDPVADMAIVRFSSNPQASNTHNDPISLPAYEAVAEYLMQK